MHSRFGISSCYLQAFAAVLMSCVVSGSNAIVRASPTASIIVVVAADGSGDFTTLQSAIETVPVGNSDRITIFVRDGLYEEKVLVRQNRVTIIGQSRDGVRLQFNAPRSEYDRRYDDIGPGVLNVYGTDVIVRNLTIENTQQTSEHAFAIYGQPRRFILDNCSVLGVGGDTLSLWNTSFGMYYHRNCRFKGGVDFVCPRGWCYVRDCEFESAGQSAAIWHDGHMDLNMKFVLQDCHFDGPPSFWLGRNHYPSQFYLLGCRFSENLDDKPIGVVKDISEVPNPEFYERKYFHNCHREGGNYAWHADNLSKATGNPSPAEITPAWTFGGHWDPESTVPPCVVEVETDGNKVHLHLSECVTGAKQVKVVREDGSSASLRMSNGTDWLTFAGGTPDSPPSQLELNNDSIFGTVATLRPRQLASQALPESRPREEIKIVLVGDSTVATYETDHAYQGWGWALEKLFDDRVSVVNEARGGRSSMSYRSEGHWDRAAGHEADYLLIQFGHNDNPGKGPQRETDPEPGGNYRSNLARYTKEARALGAQVVLVSPTARRNFVEGGLLDPRAANLPYAEATLAVAQDVACPVVDLSRLTRELFERMGETASDWIQPVGDATHFTPAGAKRIAAVLARKLVVVAPELKLYLRPDVLVSRRGD